MVMTMPLGLDVFCDLLPIQSMTMSPAASVATSRTRGGDTLVADLGARLWQGEIRLGRMLDQEFQLIRPLIERLCDAGASFMVTDPLRSAPRDDPDGSLLGAAAPYVYATWSREIAIQDLPVGYWLRRDDLLAFPYGADPVRYALHRVVEDKLTSSTGRMSRFEVTPPIRRGVDQGAPITLLRPACKAMILPDSVEWGSTRSAGVVEGVSFKFRQLLR